jgi:hypothetical protein
MADDLKPLLDAMRQESTLAHAETRRHFEVVAERVEKKVDALAEAVVHLDQKFDREAADIRAAMRNGFAETQP